MADMEKISLAALARQELAKARSAGSGRSAHTVYGGHEHTLRQTLLALTAGHGLDEHESPGEATLQVLQGRIRLTTAQAGWDGAPGDLLIVPAVRHAVAATEDAVVLLTVAKPVGPHA